ncbi:MAG: hypothetical protein WD768_18900 [Phycisphaeraceae bacterium]
MMRYPLFILSFAALALSLGGCNVNKPTLPPSDALTNLRPINRADLSADSPARLVPDDVQLYMQFDGLAQLRAAQPDDALVEHLWNSLADIRPQGMWTKASAALGLTEEQLVDRYFGTRFVIVGERPSTASPIVVLSQVEPEHLKQLPQAMGLKPIELSLNVKPFETWVNEEASLFVATHDRWLVIASKANEAYAQNFLYYAANKVAIRFLSESAWISVAMKKSLAEHPGFQDMLTKLPPRGTMLLYTHETEKQNQHAVVIDITPGGLTARYAGRIEKIDELYAQFEQTQGVDFGLLPRSVLMATTVNLMKRDQKGIGLLNLFIIPRTIETDVLPKLSAPIIAFLSQIEGDAISPRPDVKHIPAVGLAIHMKDPAVADDLGNIMGGLHFIASAADLDLVRGVFGGTTLKRPGYTVRELDFGQVLIKQIKDRPTREMFAMPDAAGLTKIYYGTIGSWFVICSQEELYRQCVEAEADTKRRLTASPILRQFPFASRDGLLVSGMLRAPEFVALTNELADYWKKMEAKGEGLKDNATDKKKKKDSAAHRITQPVIWVGEALKHRHSFYVQIWRDTEGDLQGELRTVQPVKE